MAGVCSVAGINLFKQVFAIFFTVVRTGEANAEPSWTRFIASVVRQAFIRVFISVTDVVTELGDSCAQAPSNKVVVKIKTDFFIFFLLFLL